MGFDAANVEGAPKGVSWGPALENKGLESSQNPVVKATDPKRKNAELRETKAGGTTLAGALNHLGHSRPSKDIPPPGSQVPCDPFSHQGREIQAQDSQTTSKSDNIGKTVLDPRTEAKQSVQNKLDQLAKAEKELAQTIARNGSRDDIKTCKHNVRQSRIELSIEAKSLFLVCGTDREKFAELSPNVTHRGTLTKAGKAEQAKKIGELIEAARPAQAGTIIGLVKQLYNKSAEIKWNKTIGESTRKLEKEQSDLLKEIKKESKALYRMSDKNGTTYEKAFKDADPKLTKNNQALYTYYETTPDGKLGSIAKIGLNDFVVKEFKTKLNKKAEAINNAIKGYVNPDEPLLMGKDSLAQLKIEAKVLFKAVGKDKVAFEKLCPNLTHNGKLKIPLSKAELKKTEQHREKLFDKIIDATNAYKEAINKYADNAERFRDGTMPQHEGDLLIKNKNITYRKMVKVGLELNKVIKGGVAEKEEIRNAMIELLKDDDKQSPDVKELLKKAAKLT